MNHGISHLLNASRFVACGNRRAWIATTREQFEQEPRQCLKCAKILARWQELEARRVEAAQTSSPLAREQIMILTDEQKSNLVEGFQRRAKQQVEFSLRDEGNIVCVVAWVPALDIYAVHRMTQETIDSISDLGVWQAIGNHLAQLFQREQKRAAL